MARVAIVIVTWNSEAEIGSCLAALDALSAEEAEIVVVDNASSDGTVAAVRKRGVNVIANQSNRGFAAAVNQGVAGTAAPLILLLNPDAQLLGGLDAMAARFSDPRVGAVGGLLIGDDGRPQQGFMVRCFPRPATLVCEVLGINRVWPRNPLNWQYRCLSNDPMAEARVDQPAGAFVMFSRPAWEQVGGFDERFWPLWFEDVDFFKRIKSAGLVILYTPGARAKHAGSHSIGKLRLENRETYWYGNLLEYAAKHYNSGAYRIVCMAVVVGAGLRAVWGIPRFGLKAIAVYSRVLRLSASRFWRPRTGDRKSLSY
jgi:GT2 family glycosyltransferase